MQHLPGIKPVDIGELDISIIKGMEKNPIVQINFQTKLMRVELEDMSMTEPYKVHSSVNFKRTFPFVTVLPIS